MRIGRLLGAFTWVGLAALGRPQDGPAKLQLPAPVQVRGVVVDSAGDPIPDVQIDHIALTAAFARADSSGHFDFEAKGPSVVFRKKGWMSRLVRLSSSTGDIRVVLDRASEPEPLLNCSNKERCGTAPLGNFCFPKIRGLGAGDRVPTTDTFEQQFNIHSWFGPDRTMLHGAAPSWGGPEPRAQEIWDSVEFSEIQRTGRGSFVLDARGKTSDGKLWRSIGQSGESIFYFDQNQKDAILFDRVLDGLCILVANR
jgi:hypothetical protein